MGGYAKGWIVPEGSRTDSGSLHEVPRRSWRLQDLEERFWKILEFVLKYFSSKKQVLHKVALPVHSVLGELP